MTPRPSGAPTYRLRRYHEAATTIEDDVVRLAGAIGTAADFAESRYAGEVQLELIAPKVLERLRRVRLCVDCLAAQMQEELEDLAG